MILTVHIDDATEKRLRKFSADSGRTIEDLAESAISEAALDAFRGTRNDPAARVKS